MGHLSRWTNLDQAWLTHVQSTPQLTYTGFLLQVPGLANICTCCSWSTIPWLQVSHKIIDWAWQTFVSSLTELIQLTVTANLTLRKQKIRCDKEGSWQHGPVLSMKRNKTTQTPTVQYSIESTTEGVHANFIYHVCWDLADITFQKYSFSSCQQDITV